MTAETQPRVGRAKRSRRVPPALVLSVLLGLGALAIVIWQGIDWQTDTTPVNTVESVRLAEDVAILSIDFDPPLGSVAGSTRQRALLAVVDNRGTEPQPKLLVEAEVVNADSGATLGKAVERVTNLTPGEVKVVRFERIGQIAEISPQSRTSLIVRVRSAVGNGPPNGTKSLLVEWASVLKVD